MIRVFKHKVTGNIEKINNDILVSALLREGYEEIESVDEESDKVDTKKTKK